MQMTEKEVKKLYRQFDAECGRVADRVQANRESEPFLFIPTPQNQKEVLDILANLMDRARELPAPDRVFALLQNHLEEFVKGQVSTLESSCDDPYVFIVSLSRFIDFNTRKDSRFAEERSAILRRRFRQADAMWEAIHSMLPSIEAGNVERLANSCDQLAAYAKSRENHVADEYAGLPSDELAELSQAFDEMAEKSSGWAEAARAIEGIQSDADSARPSVERYREILAEERGVELDEIVEWHEDEVNKTRREMLEIAANLDLGDEPNPTDIQGVVEVLNKYAGPADTAEEMFARCTDYLARAREGTKGYVNLPDEICRVVPMEEYGRAQNPWGGYRGGDPRRKPLLGQMVLNDGNLDAITDGWIKINAVHEAYPGHHVQYVRTASDPLPETVKLGARATPLIEGTCLRTERVFEFVFPEDQFYPLMVAYRRHHTSVRIKVDLYLFYYQRPIEDAVQLYMDELGFSRRSARGQVLAQELGPGYFTCYYYGLKRILELQEKFGYDDQSFTEILFSVGRISLKSFEAFLNLSEADRKRFLTDFGSLLEY